jgi:hypothetical protein
MNIYLNMRRDEMETLEPIDFSKENSLTINKDNIDLECDLLASMLRNKNHDYGNSVQEQFDEYGLVSIVMRLDDKLRRLKTLLKKKQKVTDESILDTLQDLAGYSVLGSICVQIEMEGKK